MPASTGSRTLITLAAVAVGVSASACGLGGPGPAATVTVTAAPGEAPHGGPQTERYTSSPVPVRSSPGTDPTSLHPLAGGPVPDHAFELDLLRGEDGAPRAALQTPSGNIRCQFGGTVHGCGVTSYRTGGQYGATERGPRWWFDLADGTRPSIDATGDPAGAVHRQHPAQVLDYGQVAFSGDDVCASEEKGLTCWNARTGHGVFLSRDGYQTF